MVPRAVPLAVLGVSVPALFFLYRDTISLPPTLAESAAMMDHSGDLSDLVVSLSQTKKSPPTITVTLSNESPSKPYTVLNWDSAFDSVALGIGVFHIFDSVIGEELPSMEMKLNRVLPPPREDLIDLAPGKDFRTDVKLEPPLANLVPGREYKIQAKGRWKGAWPKAAEKVTESDLKDLGGGDCLTGDFESNELSFTGAF